MDLCIGEADQQATGFGGGWTADQAEDEEAEAEDLTPHWKYTLYNMSSRSVLQCNSSVRPAICIATIKGLFLDGLYKVWDREGSTVGSLSDVLF